MGILTVASELHDLMPGYDIEVTGTQNQIEVKVSGNDLGYDDDQWYQFIWDIEEKSVEMGVYSDLALNHFITANHWPHDVEHVLDFTNIIKSEVPDEWE